MRKKAVFSFLTCLVFLTSFGSSSFAYWTSLVYRSETEETSSTQVSQSKAVAKIGSKYYKTIAQALDAANAVATVDSPVTVTVIPGTNPTISTDCSVSENVTLKIPYNSSGNTITSLTLGIYKSGAAGGAIADSAEQRATYLKNTVTIDAGKHLVVNGSIEVGGIYGSAVFQGTTSGDFCQIIMNDGALITVDGGILRCAGYIKETAESLIDVKNGGVVYEPLAIDDYPGSVTNAYSVAKKTFPFDYFDMRNIHSSIRVDGTSSLIALGHVFGTTAGDYTGEGTIIGSKDSIIVAKSASSVATWHYVPGDKTQTKKTDTGRRTYVTVKNGASIQKVAISLGGYDFDSSQYDLPISSYYDFALSSGDYYITENVKFLPGSSLSVESDATLTANKKLIFYQSNKPNGTNAILNCPSAASAALFQVRGTATLNADFSGIINLESNNSTGKVITGANFNPTASAVERSASTTTFSIGEDKLDSKIKLYGQNGHKTIQSSAVYYSDSTHWDGAGGKYPLSVTVVNESQDSQGIDETLINNAFEDDVIIEDSITVPETSYGNEDFVFLGYYLDEAGTKPLTSGVHESSSLAQALDRANHCYRLYSRWALASAPKVSYRIDTYGGDASITQGTPLVSLLGSSFGSFAEDTRAVSFGNAGSTINIYRYAGWEAKVFTDETCATIVGGAITISNSEFVFDSSNGVTEGCFVVFSPRWDSSDSCSAPSISFNPLAKLGLNETKELTATVSNYYPDKFSYVGGFQSGDEDEIEITSLQTGTPKSTNLSTHTAMYACDIHNLNTSSDGDEKTTTVTMSFGLRVKITVDAVEYSHDYGKQISQDATYYSSGCFAKGTLVLLPDGTSTPVELLSPGDFVMAFDHATGQLVASPITVFFHLGYQEYEALNLLFSNGAEIKVLFGHCFFCRETLRYEEILPANIEEYLGKHFYALTENGFGGWTELLDYTISYEYTECYSFSTYGTLNHVINGMLAYPDDFPGLVNYLTIGENLVFDQSSLEADIEKYGLYDYETFIWKDYITEEMFDAFNGAYLKIAVGKGLITEEEIFEYIIALSEFISVQSD